MVTHAIFNSPVFASFCFVLVFILLTSCAVFGIEYRNGDTDQAYAICYAGARRAGASNASMRTHHGYTFACTLDAQ